jgi:hypothetical protein
LIRSENFAELHHFEAGFGRASLFEVAMASVQRGRRDLENRGFQIGLPVTTFACCFFESTQEGSSQAPRLPIRMNPHAQDFNSPAA